MKKKNDKGLARRLSKQVQKLTLAHAFVIIRRDGFYTRVVKIDGKQITPNPSSPDEHRINVEVINGVVKSSWVG